MSELQDLSKENQDKNTPKARIVEKDQNISFKLGFGLLAGFIRCVENLVIVGWSIGIQLTRCTIHQTWRLVDVGIKKGQQQVDLRSYSSFNENLLMILPIFSNKLH